LLFSLHLSKAEACKSIEYAMKKCPNGMYAEIKYDGERVQVHKNGDHFSYFSRSLKPVLPHKVSTYKLSVLSLCKREGISQVPTGREDSFCCMPFCLISMHIQI